MQHELALNDLQREACQLEFDIIVTPESFRIIKRGNSSLFYQSLLPLNDPRALSDAWSWLHDRRTRFDQLDQAQARGGVGGRQTCQGNPFIMALIFVIHFLQAIAVGAILQIITGSLLLGFGACLPLMVVTWWLMRWRYTREE